jgi:hypothetical protein
LKPIFIKPGLVSCTFRKARPALNLPVPTPGELDKTSRTLPTAQVKHREEVMVIRRVIFAQRFDSPKTMETPAPGKSTPPFENKSPQIMAFLRLYDFIPRLDDC